MKAVVVLEVMWDWRAATSDAGFTTKAPPWFNINPENFTGRRLHRWLAHCDRFLVTNACPQLVSSARDKGTPDAKWLDSNLRFLAPFDLLLVCGRVAQATFEARAKDHQNARIIYMPHPAARQWTRQGLDLTHSVIKDGEGNTRIFVENRIFKNAPLDA